MTIFIAALIFMAGGTIGFLAAGICRMARDADDYDKAPGWPDPWDDQDIRP